MNKYGVVFFILVAFLALSKPAQSETINYTKNMLISDVQKAATDWEEKAAAYEKLTKAKKEKELPPKPMAIRQGEDYFITGIVIKSSPQQASAKSQAVFDCKNNIVLGQFVEKYIQDISKQRPVSPSHTSTASLCKMSSFQTSLDEKYNIKEQWFQNQTGEYEYRMPCVIDVKNIICPNDIIAVISL